MKTYCQDYLSINHRKINLSKEIACCLFILIEKYEETLNNFSKKNYAHFLINTLNYYLKDKNYKIKTENDLFLNVDEISISLLYKFIDILIHYSSIFLKNNKSEYAKLILSIGLDLINKSKYNSDKILIQKKVSIANNIACTYILLNNFYKAELFFNKCEENSKSLLDKIITYNNYCLVQIKKIKIFYNDTNKNIINSMITNIIKYLKLIYNDIHKRIADKYKIDLNNIKENEINTISNNTDIIYNPKNEIFCFLIYNYLKMTKIFCYEDFDQNYSKSFIFIRKILGMDHFITIKMIRIGNNENNTEYLKSIFLNDNYKQNKTFVSQELDFNDSILSYKRHFNDLKEEKIQEIIKVTKKEPKFEIKQETKLEIKQEKKIEVIKEIKKEIKEEKKENIKEKKKEKK